MYGNGNLMQYSIQETPNDPKIIFSHILPLIKIQFLISDGSMHHLRKFMTRERERGRGGEGEVVVCGSEVVKYSLTTAHTLHINHISVGKPAG